LLGEKGYIVVVVVRIMAYLWKADWYSSTYSFWRLENSLIEQQQ